MGCLFEKVVVKRQLDYSVAISRYGQRSVPLRITRDRTSFIARCNSAIFAFEGSRSSLGDKGDPYSGCSLGIFTKVKIDPPNAVRQVADITHNLMECLRLIT